MSSVSSEERPQGAPRKRKMHRACDYCREHRIKCVFEKPEACKHCLDYDIECERIAPPPKDVRPRKRFMGRAAEDIGHQGIEASYLGVSSVSQLVWSFCPPSLKAQLRALDMDFDLFRGAVSGDDKQGLLVGRAVIQPRKQRGCGPVLSVASCRLAEDVATRSVMADLYETASTKIITVFPVISKHESMLNDEPDAKYCEQFIELHHSSTPPTPLPEVVRIIHCALAAMSRTVPHGVRQRLLSALHGVLLGPSFARLSSISTLASVQVLVLLCMCDELNGDDTYLSSSMWLKLGTAIRMAHELALHRRVSPEVALRHGQVPAIDLDMSDGPLPQDYPDHALPPINGRWSPSFRFLSELTKLSALIGRVYRLLCSPAGLGRADDALLLVLQADIDEWAAGLPDEWPYSPTIQLPGSDLMNTFRVTLDFTLLRPFLWPIAPIPTHIAYRPTPQRWTDLVTRARQATAWIETPTGQFYLDVWSNVVYSVVCTFLVHFKDYEQTCSHESKQYLERTDDAMQAWAGMLPHSVHRNKLSAMTRMLRSTTAAHPDGSAVDVFTPGGSFNDAWFHDLAGTSLATLVHTSVPSLAAPQLGLAGRPFNPDIDFLPF
ncbi:hypothetical protein Q5752_003954 [Cryptotrichosporon argae]